MRIIEVILMIALGIFALFTFGVIVYRLVEAVRTAFW